MGPVKYWNCLTCHTVVPMVEATATRTCLACGTENGRIVSCDEVTKGFEAGVYFNIDPRTGKRAKKPRR